MKKKIKYSFGLKNEYKGVHKGKIKTTEVKTFVPKILDCLLNIDEVLSKTCFAELDFSILSFDILFVNDEKIYEINMKYREKDCPTDVITFALFADDDFKQVLDKEINLGEIIISLDTAARQAKTSLRDEILTLICHGILHLFGFDHQIEEDYNFIVNVQNMVLNNITAAY